MATKWLQQIQASQPNTWTRGPTGLSLLVGGLKLRKLFPKPLSSLSFLFHWPELCHMFIPKPVILKGNGITPKHFKLLQILPWGWEWNSFSLRHMVAWRAYVSTESQGSVSKKQEVAVRNDSTCHPGLLQE